MLCRRMTDDSDAYVAAEELVKEDSSVPVDEEKVKEEKEEVDSNIVDASVITPTEEVVQLGLVSLLENGSILRHSLSEIYETCSYTRYDIFYEEATAEGKERVPISEYLELCKYITPPPMEEGEVKKSSGGDEKESEVEMIPPRVVFRMCLIDYDEKSALVHANRFQDLLLFPPRVKAIVLDGEKENADADPASDSADVNEEAIAANKEKARSKLPSEKDFLNESVNLKKLYDSTLYSVGNPDDNDKEVCLGDTVLNVSYSGWNPPPFSRSAAGDLCYLEVRLASNSVIHVTAIAQGFYVNRCTLNHFDPAPAERPCFSHELVYLLAAVSPSFREQWELLGRNLEETVSEKTSSISTSPANALQSIASLYKNGYGDQAFQTPQWHTMASTKNGKHRYDSSRAQLTLTDSFGVDEKGVLRDWNEEFQSVLAIPAKNVSEEIMKNRLLYRASTDFSEACRRCVVAIYKGHILPANPMDSKESQVYLYNNIFFSRAIDTKEGFKLCTGNEACRKYAAQDIKNQKILHTYGIESLSPTLSCVIDYLGERFIGQGVIPGVLKKVNDTQARLMYGALEEKTRLKAKTSAVSMMREVGKALNLVERSVDAVPHVNILGDTIPDQPKMENDIAGLLDDQPTTVKIDDDDESHPLDSKTISHIGPLEGKILEGTDNRLYILDMNRLTPLDANYITKDNGGTDNIKDLSKAIDSIRITYCLRHELLQEFVNAETVSLRQTELQEMLLKMREDEKESDASSLKEDKDKENVKEESEANNTQDVVANGVSDDKTDENIKTQIPAKELERISSLQKSYSFNPNCFFGKYVLHPDDAESAEALKQDEELARTLATFLWTKSLPNLTAMVRIGNYNPIDGKGVTEVMHARGINMRYLGQLAVLANEAEASDREVVRGGKVMKNPMPFYWLELLVTEILARSMKHVLNAWFVKEPSHSSAPATLVATFLNYLLRGMEDFTVSEKEETKKESGGSKKKNKKSKEKSVNGNAKSNLTDYCSSKVPFLDHVSCTKDEFWKELMGTAESRFLFNGLLIDSTKLSPRISRLSLLRRICQVCGIRVLCRDYDFSLARPFSPSDIQEMQPVMKGHEPLVVFAGGQNLLQAARAQLQAGHCTLAYELAQEASKWLGQVTGPVHATTCQAIEVMSSVLVQLGSTEAAISPMNKKLALETQMYGLDSSAAVQSHFFLGTLYHSVGNYCAAVSHFKAALYVMRLTAGNMHPEVANIYFRLALIYQDVGSYEASLELLSAAQKLNSSIGDLGKNAPIIEAIATVYAQMKNFKSAIQTQKECWNFTRQLWGEEDSRTEAAKKKLADLIRENAEYNEQLAQEKKDRERSEKVNKSASLWLDDDFSSKKKSSSKKKGKKKGKSAPMAEPQW